MGYIVFFLNSQIASNNYVIITIMKTEPLIKTNPYLQDPVERQRLIARSVKTSCGVEGIKLNENIKPLVIVTRRIKRIYKSTG